MGRGGCPHSPSGGTISSWVPSPEGTSHSVLTRGGRANTTSQGACPRAPQLCWSHSRKKKTQNKANQGPVHVGCKATMTILCLDGACPLFTRRWHGAPGGGHICAGTSQPWEVTALYIPHIPLSPIPLAQPPPGQKVLNISNEVRTSFLLMMLLCG